MSDEYQSDILKNLILNSSEGQNIELQNTNISIIYFGNPMFFILPNNDSDKGILVEVKHNVLSQFIGEEKFNMLLEKLNEKENSIIVSEKPFFNGITISGNVTEVTDPFNIEKYVRVISAKRIISCMKNHWKRGHILFKGENKSYLHVNEGLRGRLARGLKPYVHTNIFRYLTQEINTQFNGEKEKFFEIIECEKCKEIEIYHVFEIANRLCDRRYCRKCSESSKYNNLMEVPFSDTFLIDIFTEFSTFFEKYMHQGKVPPDCMIDKLLRYSKLDHQLEIGVVYDDLRNEYKKRFQKLNYDIMVQLEKVVKQAEKNKLKFEEFLKYDEKFTTLESSQTTTDIALVFNSIYKKAKVKIQEFYYPNPITTVKSDEFIDMTKIDDVDFNSIINLYKDTFDLIGDHWFLANLAKVVKNAPIIEDCITADLYGSNLLNKTLKLTKQTDLHDIIEDIYNVKIRNAIAHPGRVVDKANNEIKIYDKGCLIDTIKITEFLKNVEKLINFHVELTYVKYRLAMKKDTNFLMTGGILSFQPEFYTKPNENEKPHLVINQLANFKSFRDSNKDFWSKNIDVEIIGEKEGISFSVKRNKSNFFETLEVRETSWGASNHIKEWVKMALKEKEIIVTHRYCYIPIDIKSGEENLQWIPIKIPIYPLKNEQEVFIKSMNECGKIAITSDIEKKFEKFIS
ncbi:hypothetical protein LL037_16600 [Clostridium estertheticum]|uniref:Uncharacterized protein n=1 Tax=Clostridium estertheticum TaxID=238834 RepID=A0AA47I7N4_9CLOT|nr:hypothetical protein [Clostridium estertheticum]MBU3154627.1 hypothetical protein [Clostridium estertheticum]MBU3198774.1 hypothetical protein [Clostridium estertheticum]WAG61793.1 hypothetical protein LL038_05980 [Clostridium estertheticum]WAG64086.1 hypothetical protein LL037_16600 [Clostridium estertheticum]